MNLLIISPAFYPAFYYGGPIFSLYNSTRSLANNGIQIFVATTNCNGKYKLDVTINKYIELQNKLFVKYYSGGTQNGFSLKMFVMLWKDIVGKDIIYLVSIFSPPTSLTIFLNILFRKPLILSPRGQLGEWCLKQGNILKKIYLKLIINPVANKITWEATSVSEKQMIKKVYPEAKIEVIPSIINVEEFQNEKDKVEKEKVKDYTIYKNLTGRELSNKKIIVSMGRLHKVKGFDILIEAVAQVLKEKKDKGKSEDIILLIAGEDFGEKKYLENLIDKLELKDKVFLVGNIEGNDKFEFLRNADVFALASHHENFGIVYGEALASGLPVIASKNTPWSEVEEQNCGKWVENTPANFAEAINEILNSDTVQMGKNGKNYVESNFSMNSFIKKYRIILDNLVDSK